MSTNGPKGSSKIEIFHGLKASVITFTTCDYRLHLRHAETVAKLEAAGFEVLGLRRLAEAKKTSTPFVTEAVYS